MALKIGKNDSFERQYMAKFRALAAKFGEFVEYERDRASRDIGLHFVTSKADGGEIVAPALVWFQMKGVQSDTFSIGDYENTDTFSLSLDVSHLRFWYIAPEPTYLVLYIEAADKFFVLNTKQYVTDEFGDEILKLKQKTMTVKVRKESPLDDQAFYLIKQRRSIDAWRDRIAEGNDFANVFFRDAELIRRIATASERGAQIKFTLRKYGSKMRSEAYFVEVSSDGDSEVIREHWQYMMPEDLQKVFPYVEFEPGENEYDEDTYWDDEIEAWEWPPMELPNGKMVLPEGVFEMVEYTMDAALNDMGLAWSSTLAVMNEAGFIELDDKGQSMVSVAPWHGRDV